MGLLGFAAALQRYGALSSLSGDAVVIDGPALVHRISEYCTKRRPSSSGFACLPPYSLLGSMVIGWLNELKSHNVNVRKIYFDGYLPPSKWDTRKSRLAKQSYILNELRSSNPLGSATTPTDAFSHIQLHVHNFDDAFNAHNKTPSPPFLIPAVLEALKSDKNWGPLVSVVPGEADVFCAEDVRQNGGTLLTTDSDLLIQDLGLKGNVAFLWGLTLDPPPANEIKALKMSFHDANQRLGLTNLGGLPRVAFESRKGNKHGFPRAFDAALRNAKENRGDVLHSPEYKDFMKEFELKEYLPSHHPVLGLLSNLDPRISEFVIQALLFNDKTGLEDKSLRGPESFSIFLPVLFEDHYNKSAWNDSTKTRQLGYCILRYLNSQNVTRIIEYRIIESLASKTGRQIEIPDSKLLLAACTRLITLLETLAESFSATNMRWLAFAVYWDMECSSSEGRKAISAELIEEANQSQPNLQNYSWDLMHFTAQFQAHLYSLRIVKQVLDVVLVICQDIPASLQRLHNHLTSLPPIAEWPTVESMLSSLSEFDKMGGLDTIADMLGVPRGRMEKEPTMDQTLQKSKRVKKQDKSTKPPSINRYSILSQIESR
ncbi:XPG domain containing-domain-containing protein [Annulohypoxylon stygium]|nr:XPG domain containing-domain-containing protein [Annulohypoxylon stygium]